MPHQLTTFFNLTKTCLVSHSCISGTDWWIFACHVSGRGNVLRPKCPCVCLHLWDIRCASLVNNSAIHIMQGCQKLSKCCHPDNDTGDNHKVVTISTHLTTFWQPFVLCDGRTNMTQKFLSTLTDITPSLHTTILYIVACQGSGVSIKSRCSNADKRTRRREKTL